MALQYRNDGWVKSTTGAAVSGAQVYVCTQPANVALAPPSPLANIFSDNAGLVPIVQPIVTDGFGHYDFYTAGGFYTIVIVNQGVVQNSYPDQLIGIVGGSGGIVLQTNGALNGNQGLLNLAGGAGTTIADGGTGTVSITSTPVFGAFNIKSAGSTQVPSPLYSVNENPANQFPALFVQDVNGDWHTQAGMDENTSDPTTGPPAPAGTLTWYRRQFFRDTQNNNQVGKNAFLSVNHGAGIGTNTTGNQDRALWVSMTNYSASTNITSFSIASNVVTINLTGNPFKVGQVIVPSNFAVATYINGIDFTVTAITPTSVTLVGTFTHGDVSVTADSGNLDQSLYSMTCLQAELDIVGIPTGLGFVDSEFNTLSIQCGDFHIGDAALPSAGVGAARFQYFREAGAGTWNDEGPAAVNILVTNGSTLDGAGNQICGLNVRGSDDAGSTTLGYSAIEIQRPNNPFTLYNIGLSIDAWPTGSADYALFVTSGKSFFGGDVFGITAAPGNSSLRFATTEFVANAVGGGSSVGPRPSVVNWHYQPAENAGSNYPGTGLYMISSNFTNVAPTATAPQYVQLKNSASPNQYLASADQITPSMTAGNMLYFETRVYIGATVTIRAWAGLTDTSNGNVTGGGYETDSAFYGTLAFRYSTAAGDTHWKAYASPAGGGSETVVDTGVTPSTTTGQVLAIKGSGGSSFQFLINGTVVATISTHLPTAANPLTAFAHVDNAVTGGASIQNTLNSAYWYWEN